MQQNITTIDTSLHDYNHHSDISKKLGYIVAVISEFAKSYNMSTRETANYLVAFKGIDFLVNHYEAEHLLSIEDCVDDVMQVCKNNGGSVK